MSEQGVTLQQVMQLTEAVGSDDPAFMHQVEALFMASQVGCPPCVRSPFSTPPALASRARG